MSYEMPSMEKPEKNAWDRWDEIKDIDIRRFEKSGPEAEEYLKSLTDEQIERASKFLDGEVGRLLHEHDTEGMNLRAFQLEQLTAEGKRRQ